MRTVPIPAWVKDTVDAWVTAAGIAHGRVFRAINKAGHVWGDGMTPKVIWELVKAAAAHADIEKLAPHDLRRTCARLCHLAGGELDQIQFLLGHVSIQTTERYLGCKQKLRVRRQRHAGDRARTRGVIHVAMGGRLRCVHPDDCLHRIEQVSGA